MLKFQILYVLLLNLLELSGQKSSIVAENCFKYFIFNGIISDKRTVINQKTFNLTGQQLKEIFYNDSIQIQKIVFFFYNDDKLISKEEYDSENSIKLINRYFYNPKGLLSEEYIYESTDSKLEKKYRVSYFYKDSIPIQKIIYNNDNNILEKTSWKKKDLKTIESVTYKEGFNIDHLKNKETISIIKNKYPEKVETKLFFFIGKSNNQTINYYYNTEGNLEKEILKDNKNSIVNIIEYNYNNDGSLNGKAIKDMDNKYLEFYKIERIYYFSDPGKKEMYPLN
jgi:hypothetical protein